VGLKILQLSYEYPPVGGGGSRVVFGLSRELAARGHEVHVVTMKFRGHPRREDRAGVAVHRVPCVRRSAFHCSVLEAGLYVSRARPVLSELARKVRFDVVHAHFILPGGINASWFADRTGTPYFLTAHGSDVPDYNPHRLQLAHRLSAPLWRRVAHGAQRIVCPSRSIEALVHAQATDLATTIIPYGFEPGRYRQDRPREKRILVVSRLLRRKGVQDLLSAVRDVPMSHEIHIVGDGPYLRRLRKLARSVATPVVFHGWLDNRSSELTSLYETSEIFVLASAAENFPVSLMEAMGAGLAVVTSRGTGCAEVVGDAGVLVDAGAPEELRDVLAGLVADPARIQALGAAARDRLARDFSWSSVAERHEQLYRQQAGSRDAA
jgi:glycosyltransferase involved in cell wall biosynthesis